MEKPNFALENFGDCIPAKGREQNWYLEIDGVATPLKSLIPYNYKAGYVNMICSQRPLH